MNPQQPDPRFHVQKFNPGESPHAPPTPASAPYPTSPYMPPNPNGSPYPQDPHTPPGQVATGPQLQNPSSKPGKNRFTIVVGSVTSVITLLSALLGLFQYLGTTNLPFLGFIHPSEVTILDHARSANIQDAHCIISGSYPFNGVTVTLTGAQDYTSNPNRTYILLTISSPTKTFTDEVVSDVATNTEYDKSSAFYNDNLWHKEPISSLFVPVGSQDLKSLFDLSNPKYVGRETLEGRDTYHIQGFADANKRVTKDIWFKVDNYYPAKIMISGEIMTTRDFTSWDTGTTISLPPGDQVAAG